MHGMNTIFEAHAFDLGNNESIISLLSLKNFESNSLIGGGINS